MYGHQKTPEAAFSNARATKRLHHRLLCSLQLRGRHATTFVMIMGVAQDCYGQWNLNGLISIQSHILKNYRERVDQFVPYNKLINCVCVGRRVKTSHHVLMNYQERRVSCVLFGQNFFVFWSVLYFPEGISKILPRAVRCVI